MKREDHEHVITIDHGPGGKQSYVTRSPEAPGGLMLIPTQPTPEDCREMECLIAEHLRGYQLAPVGLDYDGKNAGEVLVPSDWGDGGGFTYPPRGPIARTFHVPRWATDELRNMELIHWMARQSEDFTIKWCPYRRLWMVCWEAYLNVRLFKCHGEHTDLKIAVCACALAAVDKLCSEATVP